MTTYRNEPATIGFGPGAVHLSFDEGVGWVSADVGLSLSYESHAPEGQTRAVLELIAEQVDPAAGNDEVHVQIEFTQGDLETLKGTIESLLTAIEEDEND